MDSSVCTDFLVLGDVTGIGSSLTENDIFCYCSRMERTLLTACSGIAAVAMIVSSVKFRSNPLFHVLSVKTKNFSSFFKGS